MSDIFDELKDALFGNERQDDMRQVASRYGFAFDKRQKLQEWDLSLRYFLLFDPKNKRTRLRNILTKKEKDIQAIVKLFDFEIKNDFGTFTTTTVLVNTSLVDMPSFTIRPKRTVEKLGALFLQSELNDDAGTPFGKNYTLYTEDKETIKFYVSKELFSLLGMQKNIWVEGKDGFLLFYQKKKKQEVTQVKPFYDLCMDMATKIIFSDESEYV